MPPIQEAARDVQKGRGKKGKGRRTGEKKGKGRKEKEKRGGGGDCYFHLRIHLELCVSISSTPGFPC